jgi:hypothetical protein
MSAITDSDSAISGGSVRDVLADTNNLSERWKTASGPTHDRAGADDHRAADVPVARDETSELHSAVYGCCIPSSAVTS